MDLPQLTEYLRRRSREKAELTHIAELITTVLEDTPSSSDDTARPRTPECVTANTDDIDIAGPQALATPDTSIFANLDPFASKSATFISQFARDAPKKTSAALRESAQMLGMQNIPSSLNKSRRKFTRSVSEWNINVQEAISGSPYQEEGPTSIDAMNQTSFPFPTPTRPPLVARGMSGVRQALRRKSTTRPVDLLLGMANDDEDEGEVIPPGLSQPTR